MLVLRLAPYAKTPVSAFIHAFVLCNRGELFMHVFKKNLAFIFAASTLTASAELFPTSSSLTMMKLPFWRGVAIVGYTDSSSM